MTTPSKRQLLKAGSAKRSFKARRAFAYQRDENGKKVAGFFLLGLLGLSYKGPDEHTSFEDSVGKPGAHPSHRSNRADVVPVKHNGNHTTPIHSAVGITLVIDKSNSVSKAFSVSNERPDTKVREKHNADGSSVRILKALHLSESSPRIPTVILPEAKACSPFYFGGGVLLGTMALISKYSDFSVSNPSIILAMLATQFGLATAAEHVVFGIDPVSPAASYDTCLPLQKRNLLAEVDKSYIPADELIHHADIIHNAPMSKVRFFYFPEIHFDKLYLDFQSKFISRLGKMGDVVRQEGKSPDKTFNCSTMNLPETFVCTGWEDMEIYPELAASLKIIINNEKPLKELVTELERRPGNYLEIKERYARLQKIYENILPLIDKKKYPYLYSESDLYGARYDLSRLVDELKNIEHETNVDNKKNSMYLANLLLVRSARAFSRILSQTFQHIKVSNDIVIKRNQKIIALNELAIEDNKRKEKEGNPLINYFTILGTGHLYNGCLFRTVEPNDHEYELRHSFDGFADGDHPGATGSGLEFCIPIIN